MLVEVERDSRLHTGFLVSCMVVAVMGRLNGIALFLDLCICYTLIIEYPSTHIYLLYADINECALYGSYRCPNGCVNYPGGFRCRCAEGMYIPEKNPFVCIGTYECVCVCCSAAKR